SLASDSPAPPALMTLGLVFATGVFVLDESREAIAKVTVATATSARAPAANARCQLESGRSHPLNRESGLEERRGERRGKPAAARWSSSAAKAGPGSGRSERSAAASSASPISLKAFIACLPQLVDRSVQFGAGVRLGETEKRGDLGVAEAGEELQGDQ